MNTRLTTLPDPLITLDGKRIEIAQQWQEGRRAEMLELFREHVYGREPTVPKLHFTTISEEDVMEGKATRKKVDISFTGPYGKGIIHLILFIPKIMVGPSPVLLLINNRERIDPDQKIRTPFWPAHTHINRGYATAVFNVEDLDPDHHDGFRNGVHGIFESPDDIRPKNAWGTIAAWAWGASRVMDYMKTDSDIDANRVAVIGHSRGGKTALWAGATDERFAMVVSNNSGSTGAAISRGKRGETVNEINTRFPHWFADNYKKYNDKESQLPVDQHMLLSLIAPRLLYVASATNDEWADPESEFLSLKLAEPVYELHGYKGLSTDAFPQQQTVIHGDRTGYHLREGEHDLQEYDWKCFMDFADDKL